MVVVLGLIIGSFLNVYIYRFHTGKSLAGHSHCMSCARKLAWYELMPVVSYLALRGRCSSCGSYIPFRYVTVEVLTAALFTLVYAFTPLTWLLPVWFCLSAALVVILVYDLYHLVIPNELVLFVSALALAMFFMEYGWNPSPALLYSAGAAVGAFLFYGGLWLVSRGRWIGFGDAKLSIPLAFMLGPLGTFSFIVLSFWVGASISVCLLGVQKLLRRGQHRLSKYGFSLTMKSEVPFAPFMIIAFLLVALFGVNVLDFFVLSL
jgi:leader peptidase (prepilin peptidase)/N-methyltransferase